MINQTDMYNVKNRSSSVVVYSIPESNLRRTFAPGETKRIPFSELEKLTYQPGGRELIANFLQIMEEEVTQDLNIHREPEYNMSEAQVRDLILNGSLDAFLDALDFAPIGVIDLIKSLSVSLPITDFKKREALLKKTGFDVDKAIANDKVSKESDEPSSILEDVSPNKRRVVQEEAPQGRRTTGNGYKVINKTVETSK